MSVSPVSVSSPIFVGDTGNNYSLAFDLHPSFSADGQLVAFDSFANNLVLNDNNGGAQDVFVHNVTTGETTLVSVDPTGANSGNGASTTAVLSRDGRFVAFASSASNLVANDTNQTQRDVFLRNLVTGTTALVSANPSGGSGNGISGDSLLAPSVSDDGRFIAFTSYATDLVSGIGDTNNGPDVFVRDMQLGTTVLVSVGSTGLTTGSAPSQTPVISGNGRFVVFTSSANNLVPNDPNNAADVFVRDLQTNTTTLVSVNLAGNPGGAIVDSSFGELAISTNGRYIAFVSGAGDLVANDANSDNDVFVRDLQTNTTTLVSVNSAGGGSGNGRSSFPAMTPDGRYVAFTSVASDLTANDAGFGSDVFVRDLQLGTTKLVSINATGDGSSNRGAGGDSPSGGGPASISDDGRYVAFASDSTNLVTGFVEANQGFFDYDIFVRDLQTNVTKLASHGLAGVATTGNDYARSPVISPTGQYVAFASSSTDLVANDLNFTQDVFVHTVADSTVKLVTGRDQALPAPLTGNGGSNGNSVSADGRFVVFVSAANDLVPNDPAGSNDIFVRDRQTGTTEIVTVNTSGLPAGGADLFSPPQISADGRYVVFSNNATDLVAGVSGSNIYRRDLVTNMTALVSVSTTGGGGDGSSREPQMSADGRYIAFLSGADNLVPGFVDHNSFDTDVYLRDMQLGTTVLVSGSSATTGGGNGSNSNLALSADGAFLAWVSNASDLVSGDTNSNQDVFVFSRATATKSLVSINAAGTAPGNSGSGSYSGPRLSADGRYVVFESDASNLVAGDANGNADVFRRDLQLGVTTLVSVNAAGTGSADLGGRAPAISADARVIAFTSYSSNLVAGGTTKFANVYVRDMNAGVTSLVSVNTTGGDSGGVNSDAPSISADGRFVAFGSSSGDLVAGFVDRNSFGQDLFLRDLQGGTTTLVSANVSGSGGGSGSPVAPSSFGPLGVFSASGNVLVFTNTSGDLVTNDRNAASDVFVATVVPGAGAIGGQVFEDLNGNGVKDSGEPPLSGWTVYIDKDNSGTFTAGDVARITDNSGGYTFGGLTPGSYTVREVLLGGFSQTKPAPPGAYGITLGEGQSVGGQDFGNRRAAPDLVVSPFTAPLNARPGDSVSVTWKVTNQGTSAASGGWQDAVYLSNDAVVDATDVLLATVPHTGGLAKGASYNGSATVSLAGVLPGTYRILVLTDRRNQVDEGAAENNNTGSSQAPISLTIPSLTVGVPFGDSFTASNQDRYFQFSVAPGQSVKVGVDSVATAGGLELYVRHASPPTPFEFDAAGNVPGSPDQSATIGTSAPGVYYVLARSRFGAAGTSAFSVTATLPGFSADAVSPAIGGSGGRVTMQVHGANFSAGTNVKLISGGTTLNAIASEFRDATSLFATFDLTGVAIGNYDVRVTDGAKTGTLPAAFHVAAAQVRPLDMTLSAPATARFGRTGQVVVTFTNNGNVDVPAPLFDLRAISGPGVVATQEYSTASISPAGFFGIPANAPAGVVPPGASGRAILLFTPTAAAGTLNLGLFTPGDTNATIDWASLKDTSRPPDVEPEAWNVIWSNFTSQIGTTTDTYRSVLTANASYLAGLGAPTTDAGRLLALEMQEANGFLPGLVLTGASDVTYREPGLPLEFSRSFNQSISGRYHLGVLGRGWTTSFEYSADVDPDGNVLVVGPLATRSFAKQANGSFAGDIGETGRLTTAVDGYQLREANGQITAFKTDGTLNYQEDAIGNRITAQYSGGHLTALVHSNGDRLTFTYNAQGRIISVKDPANAVVTFGYDASGEHLTKVTRPEGVTNYGYVTGQGAAREHALASINTFAGVHTAFDYDARGKLVKKTQDGGEVTTYTYDSFGSVTVKDPNNAQKTLRFGERGQLLAVQDQLGRVTSFGYNPSNYSLASLTRPDASQLHYDTDTRGNAVRQTNGLGQDIGITYDTLFNNVLSFGNARGDSVRYEHDATGNLTKIVYQDGSSEQFGYDAIGNLTDAINRRGQEVTYTYNAQGHVTHKVVGGVATDFTYDAHQNLTSATDPNGTISFVYDAGDRLTRINYPGGRFLQFTLDGDGRRTSMKDQTGAEEHYEYTATGRLARVADGSNSTIVSYAYDNLGQVVRKDMANGTFTTYTWDGAGELLSLVNHAPGGAVNSKADYTYDKLGRRVTMTTADGTTNYAYDGDGQLTGVTLPGGRTIQYQYDPNGNRSVVTDGGVPTLYTTNRLDEYTSAGAATFTYDADGNLTSRTDAGGTTLYTYNIENRLTQVNAPGNTWSYEYDPFGNRIAQTHNGVRTQYQVDLSGSGSIIGEFSNSGTLLAHYTYGMGLVNRVDGSGSAAFYDFDGTGSTIGISGASGSYVNSYSYLPFGETLTSTGTLSNPFTYVGEVGVFDAGNGLYSMGNRNYDPKTGQFTSVDPLNRFGGDFNFRRYVHNDPISGVDPTGLGQFVQRGLEGMGDNGIMGLGDGFDMGPYHEQYQPSDNNDVGAGPGQPIGFGHAEGSGVIGSPGSWYPDTRPGYKPKPGAREFDDEIIRKIIEQMRKEDNGYNVIPIPFTRWNNCQSIASNIALLYDLQPGIDSLIQLVGSKDPNDIQGPGGFGTAHFVRPDAEMGYTIRFENDPTSATAPAQEVFVTHQLDADLDLSTFELGDFGFGPMRIGVPAGLQNYETQVPYQNPDASPLRVDVSAGLDIATRTVKWTFRSVDPLTGQFPEDALAGFLPVNDASGTGEGFVTYVVSPKSGLATGTTIDQQASIVFDTNAPLATNTFTNTIDASAPGSGVTPLPAVFKRAALALKWSGTDAGSGLSSYNVFVSDNGAPYTPLLQNTALTTTSFTGVVGHTYRFFSQAIDNVGNTEALAVTPDATITFAAPTFLDVGRKRVLTDSDGDTYTVTHSGPGTTKVALLDPDGDGKGPIDFIQTDSSTTASKVTVTVKKNKNGGDGAVSIGDVKVNGSLGTFTAKAGDVNLGGFVATGTVKAITIRDLVQSDPLLASPLLQLGGTNVDKTRITARNIAGGFTLATPGILTAIAAASIGEGAITATALGKLTTTAGAMNADLAITGSVGPINVKMGANAGTWTAASFKAVTLGATLAADISSAGSIGPVTVKSGSLSGDIDAAEKIASIGVKAGALAGRVTAENFGAVTVTGGGFTGLLASITPAADLGRTPALAKLTITGGDFAGAVSVLGSVGPVTVKESKGLVGGAFSGGLTAGKVGAFTLVGGDFSGTLTSTTPAATPAKTAALSRVAITGGSLTGSIDVLGSVGPVTVKEDKTRTGGAFSGDISARNVGKMTVVGGDFSGTLTATGTAADLGKTLALGGLSVTGGDITGDVRLLGGAGAVIVKADKAGTGGNLTGVSLTAAKIAALTVGKNVTNSLVLAGTTLGADHLPGGGDDIFGAGMIGAVNIGSKVGRNTFGTVLNSVIAAGLSNPDGIYNNGDDAIVGATPAEKLTSKIASLIIKGTNITGSYFATGKFTAKPKVGGATIDLAADARFRVA